jgi:hypothetical protein
VRYVDALETELPVLIQSVRKQRFEGLVAKRRDSRCEPGLHSGAWQKMRVNQGQEFVIGAYTIGTQTFDGLIFGYADSSDRISERNRERGGDAQRSKPRGTTCTRTPGPPSGSWQCAGSSLRAGVKPASPDDTRTIQNARAKIAGKTPKAPPPPPKNSPVTSTTTPSTS